MFDVLHPSQGVEHVVAPELGFILPGMAVGAGDSHTTTYGALGAVGFGIGTSDIEHLLATQTLICKRLKTMRVTVDRTRGPGLTAKDVIMALIRKIGADGATGYSLEFAGPVITAQPVEGRMTICNMAVERGARGVVIAPDDAVYKWLQGRPRVTKDYRAAATIDLDHDRADSDRRIKVPLLALWGAQGTVGKLYDVLATWCEKATDVRGRALDCGHSPQEEVPNETLAELENFLGESPELWA